MRQILILVLFSLFAVVVCSDTVSAKPEFLRHIKGVYGLNDDARCTLCHDIKGSEKARKNNLGAYGKDYQAAYQKAGKNLEQTVKELDSKDSDGDGATNGEELRLGTKPNDGASTPAKEALEKYRKNAPKK